MDGDLWRKNTLSALKHITIDEGISLGMHALHLNDASVALFNDLRLERRL